MRTQPIYLIEPPGYSVSPAPLQEIFNLYCFCLKKENTRVRPYGPRIRLSPLPASHRSPFFGARVLGIAKGASMSLGRHQTLLPN